MAETLCNLQRMGGVPKLKVIHTHGDWDYPIYQSKYTYTTEKDYKQLIVSLGVGADRANQASIEIDHGEVVFNKDATRIVGGSGGLTVTAILAVATDVPAGTKITVKGYYVRSLIIAGAE